MLLRKKPHAFLTRSNGSQLSFIFKLTGILLLQQLILFFYVSLAQEIAYSFCSWTFFSVHQPLFFLFVNTQRMLDELVISMFLLCLHLFFLCSRLMPRNISSPSSFTIPLFIFFSSKIHFSVRLKNNNTFRQVLHSLRFGGLQIFSFVSNINTDFPPSLIKCEGNNISHE